jgi:N-acetylmuramoyl-L-alanine amidase
MRNKLRLVVLLTSTAFAMVGCQPSAVPEISQPSPDQQTVSVTELARLLDLRVDETTPTHIILRRSGNTVMIFSHKGGSVYVNAKEVGKVSHIEAGQVYISRSIISQIRDVMGTPEPGPGPGPGPGFPSVSGYVVIDAGHGGKDPGATSCLGYYEKGINLAVASRVAYLLRQKGIRVEMTRTGDYYIELEDRAAIANRLGADLFVSIHADSFPKSSRQGFTIYIANGASWASQRAANALEDAMAGTGLNSWGTRKANYHVLVETTGPAVLVEMGHLSNRSDAALLRDSSFQDRMAQAVADGIINFLR